ncbi:MAG: chitobiase/beta-hexosaminidase C-terminal domain-containing protein, partial [Paramuribaculum sp.]|nr:chitobiase/beta-hexosaminidase C-terminal domain-containing protein [Paramuribaculum sp.]
IDGVQYRIAGYVGYADGAPVILPRAYVAAPLLRAPNPINDEAMPDQLIEMNVISNELELSVRSSITTADGIEHQLITEGTKLQYILCDDIEAVTENDSRWNTTDAKSIEPLKGETVTITSDELESENGCTIAARLAAGTMRSGVVTVRFNKIEATPIANSIAEFKEAANQLTDLPALSDPIDDETHTFYQYTGYARVREITPNYIYIRTTDKDGNLLDDVDTDDSKDLDKDAKQNRSDNSILIYNENGWNQDVVSVKEDGTIVSGTRAPLQVGDIITNFALIPTQSGFGNLVANATDFIRTFRRLDGVTVKPNTVKPVELNAQDNNVPAFTEADRMLRYSIKNVTISRTANNGAGIQRDVPADDQDVISYTYTLNIPGKPILDNGSVFDANPDLDVMYSENQPFNLEGVVMLYKGDIPEGQDGRYMLALKPESFEFSNVATPRAPRITLSGVGAKDGSFVTKATVTLESTTAENSENAVILYTKDGSDPRLSSSKRITYTGPFEIDANTVIKAYVRSNGTPNSELADTLFTRTAVDTRYIMNFISQA